MTHAIYFARYARCGPPALVLCSALLDPQRPPIGDVAILMPGESGRTTHRCLHAFDRMTYAGPLQTTVDRAELMLALAKLQAEVELAVLLTSEAPSSMRIQLEPYDPVELARWCMLGQYPHLQEVMRNLESPALAEELIDMNRVTAVGVRAPGNRD